MCQVGGVPEGCLGGQEHLPHLLGSLQLAVLAACPMCGAYGQLEDVGSALKVPPIEVQHTQETHQLGLRAWHGVGLDGRQTCLAGRGPVCNK